MSEPSPDPAYRVYAVIGGEPTHADFVHGGAALRLAYLLDTAAYTTPVMIEDPEGAHRQYYPPPGTENINRYLTPAEKQARAFDALLNDR